jgi:hypothetical protein
VTTARGSRHIWDLDAWTYQRLPHSDASFRAPQDGQVLRITRVERWPAVGGTSLVVRRRRRPKPARALADVERHREHPALPRRPALVGVAAGRPFR